MGRGKFCRFGYRQLIQTAVHFLSSKENQKLLVGEDNPGQDGGAAGDEAAEALKGLSTKDDEKEEEEKAEQYVCRISSSSSHLFRSNRFRVFLAR